MFARQKALEKRKGYNSVDRFEYLKKLVTEFQVSSNSTHKHQV